MRKLNTLYFLKQIIKSKHPLEAFIKTQKMGLFLIDHWQYHTRVVH